MRRPSVYSEDLYLIGEEDNFSIHNRSVFEHVLVNNGAVGIMGGYYEEDLPVAFISKCMLSMIDYTYEQFVEMTGAKLLNVLCPQVKDKISVEKFRNIEETKKIRIHTREGKCLWVSVIKRDSVDDTGKDIWILSMNNIDIVARREEYIKYSTSRLRDTLNVISMNFLHFERVNLTKGTFEKIKDNHGLDDDCFSIDYYERVCDDDDVSMAENIEKLIDECLIHEDDIEKYRAFTAVENLRKEFASGKEYIENVYRRKVNGEFRWVKMHLVRSNEYTDDNQIVVLYVQDIDNIFRKAEEARMHQIRFEEEQRRADKAVKGLEQYQNEIEDTMLISGMGIWRIVYQDGPVGHLYTDKSFDSIMGFSEDMLPTEKTKMLVERIVDEDKEMFYQYIDAAKKNGQSEVVYRWNHPEKGIIYIRCGGTLDEEYIKRKNIICIRGYHQDITETMKKEISYQRKLEKAVEKATKANIAKSEFLSRMSHDIRTPINGIVGMLEIAERNSDDIDRVKDCYGKIRSSSSHLLSLINDVLDMSKLEMGRIEFTNDAFDLRKLLGSCVDILKPLAIENGIEMDVDSIYDIPHPYLIGSPLHLRQIFVNVATNAIKYNKPHGSIDIKLNELSCDEDNVVYEMIISDTGIGMSKEFLKKIFEPFTQENQNARTVYGGSGLGISIVKKMLEQMGGNIEVESEKGVGSKFTIQIPFKLDKEPKQNKADKAAEDITLDGFRVLLVEDNELNMEIAQYMLESVQVEVVVARNGKEAVDTFAASELNEFDCILMDMMMPVMDGIEATKEIRKMTREDAATVPIVAMTANAFAEDVQKVKEAGMNEHIAKPIDFDRMIEVLWYFANK